MLKIRQGTWTSYYRHVTHDANLLLRSMRDSQNGFGSGRLVRKIEASRMLRTDWKGDLLRLRSEKGAQN